MADAHAQLAGSPDLQTFSNRHDVPPALPSGDLSPEVVVLRRGMLVSDRARGVAASDSNTCERTSREKTSCEKTSCEKTSCEKTSCEKTTGEAARRAFAEAGFQLEIKHLAVFGTVEARWHDGTGEPCGAIVAASERAACETALTKLQMVRSGAARA